MKSVIWGAALLMAAAAPGCKKDTPAPATAASAPTAKAAPKPAPADETTRPAELTPDQVVRVPPREARRKSLQAGAMLVCAYGDPDKFARVELSGAISRAAFEAKVKELPQDQELIFYCS